MGRVTYLWWTPVAAAPPVIREPAGVTASSPRFNASANTYLVLRMRLSSPLSDTWGVWASDRLSSCRSSQRGSGRVLFSTLNIPLRVYVRYADPHSETKSSVVLTGQ
jgi:hypothetical protein